MRESLWDRALLPRLVEFSCAPRTTARYRLPLCAGLSGEVLEWGFGSGTNLAFYPPAVRRVLAVEPSDVAWSRSARARADFPGSVERVGVDAALVELPDHCVDAVVSAWTMCTIPDLSSALAEARRVLRPDGELRFVEHGLAPTPRMAAFQQRIQPVWGRVGGGCHVDRDIPAELAAAGFALPRLRQGFVMKGPAAPWSYFSSGAAVPDAS